MTLINFQNEFLNRIQHEPTIKPTHISLYIILLMHWGRNRFKNPIGITRDIIMLESKIASVATYHKSIQELQKLGYIQYEPSFNPHIGTAVFMLPIKALIIKEKSSLNTTQKDKNTCSKNEQLKLSTCSKNEQVEKEVYIYNNNTNKNNNIYIETDVQKMNRSNVKTGTKKGQTGSQKFSIPSIEKVKLFFDESKSTKDEAERFYNYYCSNGWLVGGKSQMKNWEAAARNWILNSDKFRPKETSKHLKPDHLHVKTDKNYGEPL